MQTSTNKKARAAELRGSLLAEQARLTSQRMTDLQVLITPENTAAEDRVPLLHDQFVAITKHSRDHQRLAFIKSALQRFDRGEFGICEECEEEIPLGRLQAIPWAAYCVSCQERIEGLGSNVKQELLLVA